MKKRILSILLTLCMVLMLCPVTAFAADDCTVTLNFKYGTLSCVGAEPSPYVFRVPLANGFELVHVEDCAPYEFVGWKEAGSGTVYASGTFIMINSVNDLTFDAVYQLQGSLAVTVDGFEVGNTPADCTYSFESTIPGVTFSADDIKNVCWEEFVFYGSDYTTSIISNTDEFEADTRYQVLFDLDNKGLNMAPAVTVNGKTPEFCAIATSNGVPIQLQIACTLGTPAEPPAPSLVRGDIDLDGEVTVKDAIMLQDCLENRESYEKLTSEQYKAADFDGDGTVTESDLTALRSFLNLITIDGPDVVCAQQDYEFTVTPPAGVTLNEPFRYENDDAEGYTELTIDEDGVGHGVVPASEYGDADSMVLTVSGKAADGTLATATKTVQVSPEHIYVDGVCGCGAVLQYTVEYIGSGDDPICRDIKTYGQDLTLRGETFTMDGYVQTGWVDKETGAVYNLGDTYTENADVTLNPVFEKLITLTVPYTTTVALGDVGVPGEKTFTLALIGDSAPDKDKSNVTVSGSVTTNGKGSYNGTLTITGPEETLWAMLSEGAFVQQVDNGEAGWTVDDTVWGVLMEEIPVAYAMSDDAVASEYTVLILPASCKGTGEDVYYDLDWNATPLERMSFTNTYTKSATEPTNPVNPTEPSDPTDPSYPTNPSNPTGSNPNTGALDKVPQTGDNSNMILWIVLLLASGLGVTGTVVYSKRKI